MRSYSYSPYRQRRPSNSKSSKFKLPKMGSGLKKWLLIFLALLLGLFLIVYLALGPLRFFAAHYFGLAFFDKDYVVILQNNSELRPTGGFVTSFAEAGATMGLPSGFSFHNSYEIEGGSEVSPPYPHKELLGDEYYAGYAFRDANWNPDFPQAAQELIRFYQEKYPEKDVDGMIALNFSVIEDWIDALGGVELDGQLVTGENVFGLVTQAVNNVDRHNEEALRERKDVLGQLAAAIISKGKWHPFVTRDVFAQALETKEMFLWLKSERLQKKIEKKNWGHSLSVPEGSDFLHVNVANLGGMKGDRYVQKEVHHYVNLADEQPEATVEVTLRYPGHTNPYAGHYQGYLRIYVPASASMGENESESQVSQEGEFMVIGQIIRLEAGSSATYRYTYSLPRSLVKENVYQLYLSKQSGDDKWVNVTLEGKEGAQMSSPNMIIRENRAFYRGDLNKDVLLSVDVGQDTLAPYPVEQVFTDLNTLEIRWSELVDPESATDVVNYSLTDLDHINEEVTDEVKVVYAELLEGKRTILEISGATDQPLERYGLTLKNIRDTAGNAVDPNPKVVTVVQRLKGQSESSSSSNEDSEGGSDE